MIEDYWAQEDEGFGPGLSAAVRWAGLVIERASGTWIWDDRNRAFLDFMGAAGVNSIGHSNPGYVKELKSQLDRWMIGAHGSSARLEMLDVLRSILPEGIDRVQLYSSGSEAVEAALRLAKSATGGYEILSFWNSFHGRTAGSLAMTSGGSRGLGPAVPGVFTAPYADCSHCPLQARFPACGFACVELARTVVAQQSSGALAAIVVEPIQGRAGNIIPPPGYLTALRKLADDLGALLIVDESMTGFGRTGRMFAIDHDEVRADIMVLGKGMGGGYPVTAVAASGTLMSRGPFGQPSASSSSYGGFPLACRAVTETVRIIRDEDLAARAQELGAEMLGLLKDALADVPAVRQVRGRGLALAVELEADPVRLRELFQSILDQGVLVMIGSQGLRLYPPLTVERGEITSAVEGIAAGLRGRSAS